MSRGAHKGSSSTPSWLIVCLAAVGIALVVVGFGQASFGREQPPRRHVATATATAGPEGQTTRPLAPTTGRAVPARRVGAATPERPVSARLPNGTVVPVRAVNTLPDGRLAVPDDIRVAGWWRGGSRLGDPFGSTLLAAHVDSFTQGLGPYAALLSVRAGQQVVLTSAHLRQTFAITSLKLVPQGTLMGHHAIYSPSGPRRLVMVTCAGPYVPSKGGYQNLAVVTATPTSAPVGRNG